MSHPREEVEAAFRRYWTLGCIDETWARWPDAFTEDVHYVEHIYGEMRGRETVRKWITELMVGMNTHVHALLDWWVIEGDRVAYGMTNRYYNPEPGGPPFDFPGMTNLVYAGEGLFSFEEDYWDLRMAKKAYAGFTEALKLHGDAHIQETAERTAARTPW